ncbi:MAG: hypothetical protein KDG55_00535 [Rhodocyclaceae bacterium]|nr:hypothetical protein [Rhodocyclaceae bacterium]
MVLNWDRLKDIAAATAAKAIADLPSASDVLSSASTRAAELGKSSANAASDYAGKVVAAVERAVESDAARELTAAANEIFDRTQSAARECYTQSRDAIEDRIQSAEIGKSFEVAQQSARKIVIDAKNLVFQGDAELENEPPDTEVARLKNTIAKLEARDKVGVAGEGLAIAGGAAAGAAVSGTVAAAAGASTILGSTTLGSLLGGTFVAATPVGWVIGTAAVAAAAGYGIARVVRSGSKQDRAREELVERLRKRLKTAEEDQTTQAGFSRLRELVTIATSNELISPEQAERMVTLVENGSLDVKLAIARLESMKIDVKINT